MFFQDVVSVAPAHVRLMDVAQVWCDRLSSVIPDGSRAIVSRREMVESPPLRSADAITREGDRLPRLLAGAETPEASLMHRIQQVSISELGKRP